MIERIITRPLVWTVRWLGAASIVAFALLLIALSSVTLGLAHVIRGLDVGLLLPVAVSGSLLGWALAKSPLPGWLAAIVACGLGVEIALVRAAQLGGSLLKLTKSLAELTWGSLRWPLDGPPDTSSIAPTWIELDRSVHALLNRTQDWLVTVTSDQVAFDPMSTALVWSLILWLAVVWAGWELYRHHRPLHALTPAGTLLAATLSYTWDDPLPLWTLLAAILLLMLLMEQIARERRWQATGMDFSPELRLDLALVTIPLSVVLLVAALLAPSVSVHPLTQAAQRLVLEHLSAGKQVADSMGLEPLARSGTALSRVSAGGLPNSSLISAGPDLSEQVVMLVYPEGPLRTSVIPSSPADTPQPYYWRALTYDSYTGRGWRTSETAKVTYRAGESATPEPEPLRPGAQLNFAETSTPRATYRTLRQRVEAVGDLGGLLYADGELVTADHDYIIAWRSHHDVFGAEIAATGYRADSLLPAISEAQLRAAGNDYPDWLQERYLALPQEVPTRVLSLAYDLTATARTPYDQARAIETYLRTFPYTLDLPAPPPNREIADYFLFDLQKGYCDYYATTMVVLARAVGLPARLAVGYASGTYDPVSARYTVTAADAHSWVQVYFPGYGWVAFEPTRGRPPLVRPAEISATEITQSQEPLEPLTGRRIPPRQLILFGTLGSLVSLGIIGLALWSADSWRLRHLPPAAAVDTLYQRLYRHGRRLAVPTKPGDTPYEFAAGLTERVTDLAQDRRLGATSTSTNQEVRWLTNLYVRGLYSLNRPVTAERSLAIKTWRRLRRKLWLAWIWKRTSNKI